MPSATAVASQCSRRYQPSFRCRRMPLEPLSCYLCETLYDVLRALDEFELLSDFSALSMPLSAAEAEAETYLESVEVSLTALVPYDNARDSCDSLPLLSL